MAVRPSFSRFGTIVHKIMTNGEFSGAPKGIVLIVEDEPLLRMLALDFLEDAGFAAIEAANADEAIRILEARPDIHVVFTDIDMPGSQDGLKLAAAVRDRWPPIEIIVTSGQNFPSPDRLPERARFFPKPYDTSQIVRTIEEFVGRG